MNESNLQFHYRDISICTWKKLHAMDQLVSNTQALGTSARLCMFLGLLELSDHHQGLEQPAPGEGAPGHGRGWTEMGL